VQETGDFELDGVTFPAAEVALEFIDPAAEGRRRRRHVPHRQRGGRTRRARRGQRFAATLINAGIPTIFLNAQDLGYTGTELQAAINTDPQALARFEAIRAHGALRMGLIQNVAKPPPASTRPKSPSSPHPPATPRPAANQVKAADIDLLVRALSMGQLHHAMMGTAAVAIGTAAAIPGTLVNLAAGGGTRSAVRVWPPLGHPARGRRGRQVNGQWQVTKALMSRSARILMEGWVRVPGRQFLSKNWHPALMQQAPAATISIAF
jgi:2-methylaconitate cis-trans-isomerase PrpF